MKTPYAAVMLGLLFVGVARGQETWDQGFPIMTWELAPHAVKFFNDPHCGLSSLKECGFTVAGFVRPEHLKECEKLGLKAIVCQAEGQMKLKGASGEEIDAMVKKLVDESGDSASVIGYFIRDEPGAREFPELAKAVAAVKKYAPGKLAYINLLPGYATLGEKNPNSQLGTDTFGEYLERFVKEVKPQLLSYDNYQVEYSMDMKEVKRAASYFRDLMEVRRVAMEHGLPYWNIVNCNEIRPHTPVPSPANLQLQAYTTLCAGFKGVTWFKYYQGGNNSNAGGKKPEGRTKRGAATTQGENGYRVAPVMEGGERTASWIYLKMVNEQLAVLGTMMKPMKSTGVYFSAPAPAEGLAELPGKIVQEVTCDRPVMVGEFEAGDGGKFVMVVNLSLEASAKFTMKCNVSMEGMKMVSPADGRLIPMAKDGAVWLTAGQGVLLKL